MPKLAVNGLKVHVQRAGDSGPDVVLIHGVTGDLSIWFLCKAMTELAPTHKVTAYDLRGHGYSDAPPTGYTSADLAGDLLALMDAVRDRTGAARRPQLRGGGRPARGGDGARSGRGAGPLRSVLPRPPAPGRPEPLGALAGLPQGGGRRRGRTSRASTGTTSASSSTRSATSKATACSSSARPSACPRWAGCSAWPGRPAATTTKVEAGLTAEHDRLAVRQPTLAIYGDASPFLSTAQYLADHLPDCRTVLVPNSQHRAPEENPEAFTREVRWLPRARWRRPGPGGGPPDESSDRPDHRGRQRDRPGDRVRPGREGLPADALIDRDRRGRSRDRRRAGGEGAKVAHAVADVSDRRGARRRSVDARIAGRADGRPGRLRGDRRALDPGPPDLDIDGLRAMLEVNVVGVARSIDAVLPG